MRTNRGFTLLEMTIATALFAAGSLFVYSTFAGVTKSSRSATVRIDLGSQNKRALTRLYNELQASSVLPQKADNLDAGTLLPTEINPDGSVNVMLVAQDDASPLPHTVATIVDRTKEAMASLDVNVATDVGATTVKAREKTLPRSSILTFRKVIGYAFTAGEIGPEWSARIIYRVNARRQLTRQVGTRPVRVVAHNVDVFHVDNSNPDGTLVITLVTAKPDPTGDGWRRYANNLTIHPKN